MLLKHLVPVRFQMRRLVHLLTEFGEFEIHSQAGAALIAERAVLRQTMPWIHLQAFGKFELGIEVKFLPGDMHQPFQSGSFLPMK